MANDKQRTFTYRPHMNIGSMSAEEDEKFLNECFVQTGDFEVLKDFTSPKCILLGRTGCGKSAIIIQLRNTYENVIDFDPESLSLNYVSNSDVLKFFSSLGVNLDIFYNLLWKHVICVELLKYHFKLKNESDLGRIKSWFLSVIKKDRAREVAINYLEKWNSKFWIETEERIKEITEKLENQLSAGVNLEKFGINAQFSGAEKLTSEAKSEIVHNAQKIVSQIQIKDLSEVIKLLAEEVFTDPKKQYFIVIDRLDENWVGDELKYKLIRALIETIKNFRKIQNVKIIVALRTDLLEMVYSQIRDSRFQEEKYEDLNLNIRWNSSQIKKILDKRINLLFRDQYTKGALDFYDIFPLKVKQDNDTFDYIVQRTLLRPRDAIAFVNEILKTMQGTTRISGKAILDSERLYSEKRKQAILQEWHAEYPKLDICSLLLQNKPTSFPAKLFMESELDQIICKLIDKESKDPIELQARIALSKNFDHDDFRNEIIKLFYKVGFIGIKTQSTNPWVYCFNSNPSLNSAQINQETKIQVHPMFWLAFANQKLKKATFD